MSEVKGASYHAVYGDVVVVQRHAGGPRVAAVHRVVQVGVGRHGALTGEAGIGANNNNNNNNVNNNINNNTTSRNQI